MKAGRPEEEMEPEPDPELAAKLARWAEREHESVEEASRAVTEEDRRRAATLFDELARKRTRSRFTSPGPLLVAAALVIAVGVSAYLLGRGDAPDDDGPTWLDRSVERELVPKGPTPAYDLFSWTPAEDETARYGLRVFNGDELEPALSKDVRASSYAPTPEERATLADEIRWEVVLLDESGLAIDLWGSESASRSSR